MGRTCSWGTRKEMYFQNFEWWPGDTALKDTEDNAKTNLEDISYGDMNILAHYHVRSVAVRYNCRFAYFVVFSL